MNVLEISVRAEYTPNPNSLKFICSETLYPYSGSLSYTAKSEASQVDNSLAARLFDIKGLVKVFIMSNFVTVDKEDDVNWKDVHVEIKDIIRSELRNFQAWASKSENVPQEKISDSGDSEGESKRARIETVLNKIRPALVADGGNIELVDIIERDVRLRMVGACGTCPSSLMTMKMGVERALTSELPDIVETVTQVY